MHTTMFALFSYEHAGEAYRIKRGPKDMYLKRICWRRGARVGRHDYSHNNLIFGGRNAPIGSSKMVVSVFKGFKFGVKPSGPGLSRHTVKDSCLVWRLPYRRLWSSALANWRGSPGW